ncbi:hypothetical protein [Polaribacter atrinae]|uniref:Uncharacterized protein n=1 Tax=Polaribacter atrinae TaxID=1333662 RepID=A0A176TF37_9FLAO|nr:hypothetical protein [Polaribacter atrinae]OAD46016.1 hypothetical protein LPB303_03615 [Polaribacter atrinae]
MEIQKLLNYHKNNFIKDYGEIKYEEIYEKVRCSKHLKRGLRISESKGMPLLAGDFLQIGAAHAGLFGKKSTRVMGALVALELWHEELNYDYELASTSLLLNEIRKCMRGY